jgi:SNF2 family DNA or RNA helicase
MSERIDMSAFEAQFGGDRYDKRMSNDDFERLGFLNVRIPDISGVIDLRKEENDELEFSKLEVQDVLDRVRLIKAYFSMLETELLRRRRPIDEAIHYNDTQNREDKRTREIYERERARLLQELAAIDRLAAMRKALNESTANKPWRVGTEDGKKALPHQLEGAHRLVSAERGLLADKPGLGKTLQAIITIDMLRAQGKAQKVLIFTPKSVLPDFERAFKKWTDPTLVHVLNQTARGVKADILDMVRHIPMPIVVITNYEVWRKDRTIHDKLIACGFDTVFMDEAHVLKDTKSRTSQDVRQIIYAENLCPQCGAQEFVDRMGRKMCGACEFEQDKFGDFCSVKNVFPMTGTPILNKPAELFPLLNMIDRTGFPKEKYFLEDYCHRDYDYSAEKYIWTFGNGGSERLLKKLGMKYTGRTRDSAGVKMPPQEVKHHWLELDPEQYPRQHEFIRLLRDKARIAFSEDKQITTDAVLQWYTRMRQAASWPDGIQIKGCPHDPLCWNEDKDEPGKCYSPQIVFPPPGTPPIGESIIMDEAQDITFEAVEDGDRIVVFTWFRSVVTELERRCKEKGLRVAKIVGGMPDSLRQECIDDFNTNYTKVGDHKYDVLICQYKTASVGLNLNGAQQLLMIEREWNPGKEEQAMDRLRRIDSDYESIVHMLHCKGTATELIDAIQEQKKQMLDGFQADVDLAEAMRKFLEG